MPLQYARSRVVSAAFPAKLWRRSANSVRVECRWSSTQHVINEQAAFVGITPGLTKEEQIKQKLSCIDHGGVWSKLPLTIQQSLKDAQRIRFVRWVGNGVPTGKAAIVELLTHEEADAIIRCMGTEDEQVGVMSSTRTAELYLGRINTARHLIHDEALANCFLERFRMCPAEEGACSKLFDRIEFGQNVVAVNPRIRLVTTEAGGEHQKHADIREPSEDGYRVSRLTFQCYLNPEEYEGGHFQLYEPDKDIPIDIPMQKGCAVVFVQEDPWVLHGGGRKGDGSAKRAIRGNLEVFAQD